VCRLGEVIAEAETRDGEVEELHKKKVEVRACQLEREAVPALPG
jgi:hypothetical protein